MQKIKFIFGLVLIVILCTMCFINTKNNNEIVTTTVSKKMVNVDIKGAVANPGVKSLEIGSTVNDLIEISGGLLENADTSIINLSKKLVDEMVVIVYTIDEVNEMKVGSTSVKIVEKECICPVIENDACIDTDDFITIEDETSNTKNTNKISLNHASKEELMTLSGIGSSKADAIIEYRNQTPFKTIEELTNVKGIGKATFEKIKANLTL